MNEAPKPNPSSREPEPMALATGVDSTTIGPPAPEASTYGSGKITFSSGQPISTKPYLILIRHGEVEIEWKKICYGAMDVPLSETGIENSIRLAEQLCIEFQPRYIFHSGLQRTKFLASQIARCSLGNPEPIEDTRLQERDYGDWQGKSWDEVFASDPDHFHDLIEKPETYRPPQGETTSEMQARIVTWLHQIASLANNPQSSPIIAVTHSGPIAAACGHLLNLHARHWSPWTIRNLHYVAIDKMTCNALISVQVCSLQKDVL